MDFVTIIGIAVVAAVASPLGGLIALWRTPTTLFMSTALGFASGALLAAIGFEMLPDALAMSSLATACLGFASGFAAIYLFDLFLHRGVLVGAKAEQVQRKVGLSPLPVIYEDKVTVLAAGIVAEQIVEGLSIGVGGAIQPSLGVVIASAIVIDNVGEAISIGIMIRRARTGSSRKHAMRIFGWTSLIGAVLLVSALAGWFFLRAMPPAVLGFLLAAGAGGMFYLIIADLVPEAEETQYQQSASIGTAIGFLAIFAISTFAN